MSKTPICPKCDKPGLLVTGDQVYRKRPDLKVKKFYVCWNCDTRVGCHPANGAAGDDTHPLGGMADAETRGARNSAHAAFDPLWKSGNMTRRDAYQWLAAAMGIEFRKCHIGYFNVEQCKHVCDLIGALSNA